MNNNYPLIIGNWKLNGDKEAFRQAYVQDLIELFKQPVENVNIVICPANVHISELSRKLSPLGFNIGSQNVSAFQAGAYTGETSAAMLKELGCNLCIIGHSERRDYFNESNIDCNNKIKQLHEQSILPVLCIGESQSERNKNATHDVLAKQLSESLKGVDVSSKAPVCIAYEPIWAIGSGESASPVIVQEAHQFIRKQLSNIYSKETANQISIVYGGSVNKDNAKALLAQEDVDGLLVGAASLDPENLNLICTIANTSFSAI